MSYSRGFDRSEVCRFKAGRTVWSHRPRIAGDVPGAKCLKSFDCKEIINVELSYEYCEDCVETQQNQLDACGVRKLYTVDLAHSCNDIR